MRAVHWWFSGYCPYQHRLQAWHVLSIFPRPTELENSGVGPNRFVWTCSSILLTIAVLHFTSPAPYLLLCPHCELLSWRPTSLRKKSIKQRGLVQTWNSTTSHPPGAAAKYPALSMTFLKQVPQLVHVSPSSLLFKYIISLVLHSLLVTSICCFNWTVSLAYKLAIIFPILNSCWPLLPLLATAIILKNWGLINTVKYTDSKGSGY